MQKSATDTKEKMLVITGRNTERESEMFPVRLAVCVSNEAAMQKAVLETNGSVQNTEADMRGDASVTEACVFWFFVLMGICRGTLP